MVLADPEAFLRAMVVPLSRARPGQPLPGVPFSREAVANAFVMLGLLPGRGPRRSWASTGRSWRPGVSGWAC